MSAIVCLGVLAACVQPAAAQQYYYSPSSYPPPQQDNPVLRKVLIGGALVGIGFLAGRLTAPQGDSCGQPYHPGYGYQPPRGYQPTHGGGYRGHNPYDHRDYIQLQQQPAYRNVRGPIHRF